MVIGVCQIIAGVIMIGLVGKSFVETMDSSVASDEAKINSFGPVLISILVIVNGMFGIFTICCSSNKKIDVFYLMGATVAACGAAAMVWIYGLLVYSCNRERGLLNIEVCFYSDETQDIHISLLVFSLISLAMSTFGMVTSALMTCRKL